MLKILKIKSVVPHKIEAIWSDGKIRLHDFQPYLKRWENHPVLATLAKPEVFQAVSLSYGTLAWKSISLLNDATLGLPVEDNYFKISPDVLLRDGVS